MSLNLICLLKTIEFLYRLLKVLARFPFTKSLILSDEYEYDYNVLAPLAMTHIPSSQIPMLPAFPKADELPNEKWLALVLSTISIFVNQTTSTDIVNESVSNSNETQELELIHNKIKEAEDHEDLTNAVMKLKKALELEETDGQSKSYSKTKNDIQLESNPSDSEDKFDKIDREIEAYISQIAQLESATPKDEEVEPINQELYGDLQEI